jgi:hypothetical protein
MREIARHRRRDRGAYRGTEFQAGGASSAPQRVGLPSIPGCEMEALVGHGGMGVVYMARHTKLNRPIAIKMIPRRRRDDPNALTVVKSNLRRRKGELDLNAVRNSASLEKLPPAEHAGWQRYWGEIDSLLDFRR